MDRYYRRYGGQVWLDGKWIKDVSEGIDTGESYPIVAEWIYLTTAPE